MQIPLGAEASTLDSNANDKHAASRNDRTSVVSFGIKTGDGAKEFFENAKKNMIENGMTPKDAEAYIQKVQNAQSGNKIDLHASNNPETGKFFEKAKEKDGAFKMYDDKKQSFVDKFEEKKLASKAVDKNETKEASKTKEPLAEAKDNKIDNAIKALEEKEKALKTLENKTEDKKKIDLSKTVEKSKNKENKETAKKENQRR